MSDYGKRKNDELAALCKERGLAHTGKKADLVKRLEDYDASNAGSAPPAASKTTVEDEIDWDDEPATDMAKNATSQPAADAIMAGGVGEVGNPQAVPNQVVAEDPSQTDDLSVAPPAEEKSEEKDFSTGLADITLDEEIEKRKARARKFGLPEDSDEIKALERAKRFGNTDLPGLLNKALPERGERHSGRGGVQKRGRGGKPRGRGGRDRSRTPRGEREKTPGSNPGWMSKEDREAVERRRAKFATS